MNGCFSVGESEMVKRRLGALIGGGAADEVVGGSGVRFEGAGELLDGAGKVLFVERCMGE